jgi:hypothetical protein
VRVERVGLAVVAGVEEPDPGGQLGRDVKDPLTGREQALGQRTAAPLAPSTAHTRRGHVLT